MKTENEMIVAVEQVLKEFRVDVDAGRDEIRAELKERTRELRDEVDFVTKKLAHQEWVDPATPASRREIPRSAELSRAWVKAAWSGQESELEAFMPQFQAASEGSVRIDPAGGYLVAPFVGPLQVALDDFVVMRRLARIEQLPTGDSYEELWDMPEQSIEAGWFGETEARPTTDTTDLELLRVPLHELVANPRLTQKLVDDADRIDPMQWISRKIEEKFVDLENAAFFQGSGFKQPRGLLTYDISTLPDATRPWGEIEYIATGQSAGFPASDPGDPLVTAVYRLKAPYRRNARWVMNSSTAAVVRKLKDADGNYLWRVASGFAGDQADMLLGHPVELAEDMPDIAADSLSIAFGDFMKGYLIADRAGLQMLRDPFTSKGYINLYTRSRVGGSVADFNSLKLIKFGSS